MVMVRRSMPFRLVCLFLVALVLFVSVLLPAAQAVAFGGAVAYGAVELIAAALIGGGAVYATQEEAREAAGQVFAWLQDNALDAANTFLNMAGGLIGAPELTGVGFRISPDVWQSIADAFSSIFGGSVGGLEFGRVYSIVSKDDLVFLRDALPAPDVNSPPSARVTSVLFDNSMGDHMELHLLYEDGRLFCRYYSALNGWLERNVFFADSVYDYGIYFRDLSSARDAYLAVWYRLDPLSEYQYYNWNLSYSFGDYVFNGVSSAPDLIFPSDDYVVRAPDLPDVQTGEDGQEVVVYPDLSLNPSDHLADIPVQETGDKVEVPYDTLVDVETGTQVDVGNPDIPGEGTDTGIIQNILDKISDFFDSPSDFELDFDGFKNLILPDRFPFCIPFDLINSVRAFAVTAQDFEFIIDLDTQFFSVNHTVDLSPFAVPIAFFRYTCVAFWVWVLLSRTRDLMKW